MKTAISRPNERDGGQAEVLDDLDVLPGGELPEQERRGDQQHREGDEVVEHLVAHRFPEHVHGHQRGLALIGCTRLQPAIRRRRGHLPHEEILERVANRVERHELGALRDSAASTCSGGDRQRQLAACSGRRRAVALVR